MSTDTLTLAERIEAVLVAAGFPKYNGTSEARTPHFTLSAGVGVIVGIAWRDAPDDERAALLVKYENRLRANGLTVANRGSHLYVPETPLSLSFARRARDSAYEAAGDAIELAELGRFDEALTTIDEAGRNILRVEALIREAMPGA